MPERRRTRGPHPEDAALFAPARLPKLREAARDLGWLLTRGYAPNAAIKLVGDRFQLRSRQRDAVSRATCSDQALARRAKTRQDTADIAGQRVVVDGFNALIAIEAAMDGGVLLRCRDGCLRDLASLHGTYRRIFSTDHAFVDLASTLHDLRPASVHWLFDAPVSNSGRLVSRLAVHLDKLGYTNQSLATHPDPDGALKRSDAIAATADSAILDRCERWFDLPSATLAASMPDRAALDFTDLDFDAG